MKNGSMGDDEKRKRIKKGCCPVSDTESTTEVCDWQVEEVDVPADNPICPEDSGGTKDFP